MTFVDIFAGAGGLSEGFERAGFDCAAQVESDPHAANTLRTRAAYRRLAARGELGLYRDYLRGRITRGGLHAFAPAGPPDNVVNVFMEENSLEDVFRAVDRGLDGRKLDLLIGSPPCQAYSIVKRHAIKPDDPRKSLHLIFGRFLARYRPAMFVLENVPGLLSVDGGRHFAEVLEGLRENGYSTGHGVLNAKDFGVAQNRKRLFVIGWEKGLPNLFPAFTPIRPDWTVKDVLGDLPPVKAGGEATDYGPEKPGSYVSKWLRAAGDVLTLHKAQNYNDRHKEIFLMVIDEWTRNRRGLRRDELPERLRLGQRRTCFLDKYKVVAPDLPFSHTIVAHMTHDTYRFIHYDPGQCRGLTPREAARLQSFPDDYFFEGSMGSVYRQIGNAVPPLMARRIAEAMIPRLVSPIDTAPVDLLTGLRAACL